jgi:hypothetical protein
VTSSQATRTSDRRDPRHVFLTANEVIARYRWGRTKGYAELRANSFPRALGGRYRLDLLMAWEDQQLEEPEAAPGANSLGPPPKRRTARNGSA